jgi:Holliday junction resolvasome RuvABC endonuclease subunit
MGAMIATLLPTAGKISEDEADALSVAICHAHHMPAALRVALSGQTRGAQA